MSHHTAIEAEEEALGVWPRRLLHLPSMTSYEWQPGNFYGPYECPAYNAITYTWGRWALKHDEYSHVRGMKINNVPWDTPRIHPDHFTPEEMMKVLESVAKDYNWCSAVEFIWLDIACIDQRPGEPRSAAEIGRQAIIFTKASAVCIWLSTIPHEELFTSLAAIKLSYLIYHSTSPEDGGFHQLEEAVSRLFADPWFSSLWTLQEASLRQDAVFLSREGVPVVLPPRLGNGHPSLADDFSGVMVKGSLDTPAWHQYFQRLWSAIGRSDAVPVIFPVGEAELGPESLRLVWWAVEYWVSATPSTVRPDRREKFIKISNTIYRSGLPGIAVGNPLAVYTTTSNRNVSQPEDAIYGIQQIFRIRVGRSAPDHKPGVMFTLPDLETQFGEKLLQEYPMLSQMHVHTVPVPLGTAWRVRNNSLVVENTEGWDNGAAWPLSSLNASYEPLCTLGIRRVGPRNEAWGHFEGRVCRFDKLREVCESWGAEVKRRDLIHEQDMWDLDLRGGEREYRSLNIALDATAEMCPRPTNGEAGLQAYNEEAFAKQDQNSFFWEAIEPVQDQLRVLLLGMWQSVGSVMLGVLLLPGDDDAFKYHQRIGICWWNLSDADLMVTDEPFPERPFLGGEHQAWKLETGLFG